MRSHRSKLLSLASPLLLVMAAGAGTAAKAQAPAPVVYTIEELRTGPIASELQQKMIPLHTLGEIEGLLKANRIAFAWGIAELSADKLTPESARQMAALPPREVFVNPGANGVIIGVIIARR
jgi:hypothetical protein